MHVQYYISCSVYTTVCSPLNTYFLPIIIQLTFAHFTLHPPFFLLVTTTLFSVFLFVFVFILFTHLFIYIPHMNETIRYFSFFLCLIMLSIIPSRSIHVVTNKKISPFFLTEKCLIIGVCVHVYAYICKNIHTISLSIHLLIDT